MKLSVPLNMDAFECVIKNAPLFAIDIVVINSENEILVGRRKNAPAKGYWFVPGGRVYKNEPLDEAFKRISMAELGQKFEITNAKFLGLYEHFYPDSFVSSSVSTHYINATHALHLEANKLDFPKQQHDEYRWVGLECFEEDKTIHAYSKCFCGALYEWLESNKKA